MAWDLEIPKSTATEPIKLAYTCSAGTDAYWGVTLDDDIVSTAYSDSGLMK